jgi:hypothetical protein
MGTWKEAIYHITSVSLVLWIVLPDVGL